MAKLKRKQVKNNQGKSGGGQSSNYCDNLKGKPGRKRHTVKVQNDLRIALESDGSKEIIDMEADGNCLFRSLSDQLFRDHGEHHVEVRQDVCDFMEGHKEEFKVFLVLDDAEASEEDATDFDSYLKSMRGDGEWGGNLELVAAARMYRRDVRVFSANFAAFTVSHGSDKLSSGPDILLSYHNNLHYNSVRLTTPPKLPLPVRTFVKSDWEATEINPKQESGESVDTDALDDIVDETIAEPVKEVISTAKPDLPIENPPTPSADINREPQTSADTARVTKRPITRHAQCPCGSGKKYRKCCHARERLKLKFASTALDSDDLVRDVVKDMDGTFRILHI